jgi:hypothetical protein
MNGRGTLKYLLKKFNKNKRIVFSRYGDGEYYLMTKKKNIAGEEFDTGELLKSSLKIKNQLICTVFFRKSYEELQNISCKWANTQKYIIENTNLDIYGTGAFLRRDYLAECSLIPNFFINCLLVTGHFEESKQSFKKEKIKIDLYEMPKEKASNKYLESKKYLIENSFKYENIIFCCGPIGKVLIGDLVNHCNSNLIDFGSMIM